MSSLREVAELANVSVATASRVLNRTGSSSRFSDQCALRVREAAEHLGYIRNYHASSLRAGRSQFLGFAYEFGPDPCKQADPQDMLLGNDYWGRIIGGVAYGARKADYQLTMIGPSTQENVLDLAFRYLKEKRIDGLVVPSQARQELLRPLVGQSDVPVVIVGHAQPTVVPVVDYDDEAAVRQCVDHLIELGHRRILRFGPESPPDSQTPDLRARAFAAAACELGVVGKIERYVTDIPYPHPHRILEFAHQRFAKILDASCNATAVVCYNDHTAVGVYRAVLERGLRIPTDMSVVGFDDFISNYMHPALTSVSHRCEAMGMRAAELLLSMIDGKNKQAQHVGFRDVLTPELVIRQSTAPPAKP